MPRVASRLRAAGSAEQLAEPPEVVAEAVPPLSPPAGVTAPRAGRILEVREVGEHDPDGRLARQDVRAVAQIERRHERQVATADATAQLLDPGRKMVGVHPPSDVCPGRGSSTMWTIGPVWRDPHVHYDAVGTAFAFRRA